MTIEMKIVWNAKKITLLKNSYSGLILIYVNIRIRLHTQRRRQKLELNFPNCCIKLLAIIVWHKGSFVVLCILLFLAVFVLYYVSWLVILNSIRGHCKSKLDSFELRMFLFLTSYIMSCGNIFIHYLIFRMSKGLFKEINILIKYVFETWITIENSIYKIFSFNFKLLRNWLVYNLISIHN